MASLFSEEWVEKIGIKKYIEFLGFFLSQKTIKLMKTRSRRISIEPIRDINNLSSFLKRKRLPVGLLLMIFRNFPQLLYKIKMNIFKN